MERITIFIRKPSTIKNSRNERVDRTLNRLRPLAATVVLSIAFLIVDVHSSAMSRRYGNRLMLMDPSKRRTSCITFVRNASRLMPSDYLSCPYFSASSKIGTKGTAWMHGPSPSCYRKNTCHGNSIFRIKSNNDPSTSDLPWRDRMRGRPHGSPRSFSFLSTHHDSKSRQSVKSTSRSNDVDWSAQLDARHWFTQLLPEGWCVGVRSGHDSCINDEESTLSSADLLHPDEYRWGLDHIASDASRASYYLGRMALRSSLSALLDSEKRKIDSRKGTNDFYNRLNDQIQSTAINKDYHGRPILPEIISGSISHKGEYAVGLARFRSSTWNAQNRLGHNGLEALDASSAEWREECPILDQDQDIFRSNGDDASCLSGSSTVRGIGIDLERIDASRGRRIERKVLTESERLELGGLEVSGCKNLCWPMIGSAILRQAHRCNASRK
jgi:hypothetical protein